MAEHPPTGSHPSSPANRLAQEKSPYLLQHAHNPVDWYPWGPEALEAARQRNQPIFLSIGYSACHWCHVMERESFEDPAVAALLNEHFISIKVDREERPDIDEIYMTAVQMMTRHGGWPLSVFLLPDGRPFYGGTYFPPENRHGRISFRSLITQLADAYRNRFSELEEVATQLTNELRTATRQRPLASNAPGIDVDGLLEASLTDMAERFDSANGGFGAAPKFPPHHALRLLLLAAEREYRHALPMALITLERMALGGIYDHIGGGFHRYSTDAVWLLPHFEKMLYDNALLSRLYAEAFRITRRECFARIARETCDWVLRDLADRNGGFRSALDADSEGEEGKYYVWSWDEVTALLGEEAGTDFCRKYHFLRKGNYREEATGQITGFNIPYLALGATDTGLPDILEEEIVAARETLRQHRYQRVPPGQDDKIITSWNGLMIGALAVAGKALNEPGYIAAAERAANFCLTALRPEGRLLHRYARGEAAIPAFLDDYAYLADGLLDLFEATGMPVWAEEARQLADALLADFWDPEDGGFFFAGKDHETLIARSKDLLDGALPSANGVAARVLVRLSVSENGDRYGQAAQALLHNYRGVLQRAPNGTHTLLTATLAIDRGDDGVGTGPPVLLMADSDDVTGLPGDVLTLGFTLRVAPGYHINAHRPTLPNLIPTTATIAFDLPASVGPVGYPAPVPEVVGGDTLAVYRERNVLTVPVRIPPDAEPGYGILHLSVRFQACTETTCLAPEQVSASVRIRIAEPAR
ncbi:MAG: DUF255 domain-containing protein [Capsulimonadales bacterium]|nr:DUF255 domain-containing protein [Capsulimonadales bacterium]